MNRIPRFLAVLFALGALCLGAFAGVTAAQSPVAAASPALLPTLVPLTLTPTPVPAPYQEPVYFDGRDDPALALGAYYNAINLNDYARAYSYWDAGQPSNGATLAQFTAGFSNTLHVEAFARIPGREGVALGSSYVDMPLLLIVFLRDGGMQYFGGCFTLRKSNVPAGDPPVEDPNWYPNRANLAPISGPLASAATCDLNVDIGMDGQAYDFQEDPLWLMESYFNAIVLKDYARAYQYWESAPENATLAQYAAGFANTADVVVYERLAFTGEGAAGSIYTSIPAVLDVTQTDNTHQYFDGCYIMRRSDVPVGDNPTPDPRWWLYSATVSQADTLNNAMIASMQAQCP